MTAADERLVVFVPGHPRNPLNGSWGGWLKHARQAKRWREATALAVYVALGRARARVRDPAVPKRITFTVRTWNPWDDDALPAVVKPCRDALVEAGVLHGDGLQHGHVFRYRQRVDRSRRGIDILVERA